MNDHFQITAIGCSGPVAGHFVEGLLEGGAAVRILARSPAGVEQRFSDAEVIAGSMKNSSDVERAVAGVDAAFLITPMGLNNDPTLEIEAARLALEGMRRGKLKHLIYASCLGVDRQCGVGILDAKYHIERMIRDSGIPHSILRCGTYMEDLFDPRLHLLRKGKFLYPLNKSRRFNFTRQHDVAGFIVQELMTKNRVLNGPIDFVTRETYSIADIEMLLSSVAGFEIRATPRFPVFHLYRALLPLFRIRKHRFSSVIPLLVHFDKNGYTSTIPFPQESQFAMTDLERHFRGILGQEARQ